MLHLNSIRNHTRKRRWSMFTNRSDDSFLPRLSIVYIKSSWFGETWYLRYVSNDTRAWSGWLIVKNSLVLMLWHSDNFHGSNKRNTKMKRQTVTKSDTLSIIASTDTSVKKNL